MEYIYRWNVLVQLYGVLARELMKSHGVHLSHTIGSCSFEAQLPLSCTVAVVTISWALAQTFSKHSSPELRMFLWHFPSDSCLKFIRTKKRRYSTLYVRRGLLLHQWRREQHLLATNLVIHNASLLTPTSKFTLAFANRSVDLKWTRN